MPVFGDHTVAQRIAAFGQICRWRDDKDRPVRLDRLDQRNRPIRPRQLDRDRRDGFVEGEREGGRRCRNDLAVCGVRGYKLRVGEREGGEDEEGDESPKPFPKALQQIVRKGDKTKPQASPQGEEE